MGNIISSLISLTLVPIVLLNYFGVIIGAIWLLATGNWEIVVGSIIIYFISSFILALVMMIPLPIQLLGVHLGNKGYHKLMIILSFIGLMITSFICTYWVLYILSLAFTFHDELNISIIPLLLLGYALATAPFVKMAQGEDKDSAGTFVTLFVLQITFIIAAVLSLLHLHGLIIPIAILLVLIADIYLLKNGYGILKEQQKQDLYNRAKELVIIEGYASPALLQRSLKIDYNTAAGLMDILYDYGVIEEVDGAKPRRITEEYIDTPFPIEKFPNV